MIKFFKSQDIIITPFTIAKKQTLNSIVNDLILGNDGDDTFPLIGILFTCDDNKSGSCELIQSENYLATSQFEDEINFRLGKFIQSSSVFYPSGSIYFNKKRNPLNLDGTYQRQVYNTVKKMYYNDYNNAYNIFGFDGYDTSMANLQLTNEFVEINLKNTQAGDKIRPKSLTLNNQSGDIIADVIDDGNHNLILSGTFFLNKYTLLSDSNDLTTPLDLCGIGGYLFNTSSDDDINCCDLAVVPTPTPTPSITITPTITPSITITPTVTPTVTPSISVTVTPTISITPSATSNVITCDIVFVGYTGGGDTFDCYNVGVNVNGLSNGTGFSGAWVESNTFVSIVSFDPFDTYSENVNVNGLSDGTGFTGDWVESTNLIGRVSYDSFDSYNSSLNVNGLSEGLGFSGNWIESDTFVQIKSYDYFDSYSVGLNINGQSGGSGFSSNWVYSDNFL